MRKALEAGKQIYERLCTLTSLDGRIYPIIAENGTDAPYCIYKRDNITPASCKDGIFETTVYYTITIVANDYESTVDIASEIADIFTTDTSKITAANEAYIDDMYTQQLQLEIITD